MRQISLLKLQRVATHWRDEGERFYATRFISSTDAMQFCFISRERVYNGALQDQSSSHLVRDIRNTRIVIPQLVVLASETFRICMCLHVRALCAPVCTCSPLPLPHFLQIFTLDFLIFAEAMMREPRVSRDDYSE